MTTMQQYMSMTQRAVSGAFNADGLGVHHLRGIQGPHTLTFALRLYEPTKTNLTKALKLNSAVEAVIGDGPARIYSERGILFVEVPSPKPTPVGGSGLHGQHLAVPLGVTARCAVAGIDFEETPHMMLVGPTNAGKTTAARGIAYHLARQNPPRHARFIVTTFKPKDWLPFTALANTCAVITTPEETEQCIAWARRTMMERARNGQDTPHLFLFLDDLLNLIGATDSRIVNDLCELASMGRAAGVHLIIGTQRLGERGAGDASITGNITTRLVFGTASAQDAAYFTGRGKTGAEAIGRYKGDALLVSDGGTQRLAVGYVGDRDLTVLRQDAEDYRPWVKTRTTEPVLAESAKNAVFRHVEPLEPPLEPVLNGSDVVLSGPARTAYERQRVLDAYARTGSKNQAVRDVWGHKNGQTWQWLNEALKLS